MDPVDVTTFHDFRASIEEVLQSKEHPPLPDPQVVQKAAEALYEHLPDDGKGLRTVGEHLIKDIVPGLNGSSLSPQYYGFVTGGVNPAARLADSVVSLFDQNVQVHLPQETIATNVEDRALSMLLELLEFDPSQWPYRTFTTGATASNVLGLGCGRDYVVTETLRRQGHTRARGEGFVESCLKAGLHGIKIFTTGPHSSLGKAASIVGIGSRSIVDVSKEGKLFEFDFDKMRLHMSKSRTASIIAVSCGEVNTGTFATHSLDEMQKLRAICDEYGAWLHVDAAFGLFARILPKTAIYDYVRSGTAGLELADSIAGDGHKLLNVPYDCGFFFSKHRDAGQGTFANTNAAYLASPQATDIQSPLNIRIENSARFRGLPVYASLVSYGRNGYSQMIARMVDLARDIADFIRNQCDHLIHLPEGYSLSTVYMCVLFRAKDDALNKDLTERIKATRKIYASGTMWQGKPATRLAIGKWDVDVNRDLEIVRSVLRSSR